MSTITAPEPYAAPAQVDSTPRRARHLGGYVALDSGQTRRIGSLQRPDGSCIVVDYHLDILGDGRVVAHISPDESRENERIICELYLADDTRGRCRALTAEDLEVPRHATAPPVTPATSQNTQLQDGEGYLYCIREFVTGARVCELRWTRSRRPGCDETFDVLTLRDVVARLEAYEPARTITSDALAQRREDSC
jgi:hypothetical protein